MKGMAIGHRGKSHISRSRRFGKVDRARTVRDYDVSRKESVRVRGEPVQFFRADHDASVEICCGEPLGREREPLKKGSGIADKCVIERRAAKQ
jgi:hypothetical protein